MKGMKYGKGKGGKGSGGKGIGKIPPVKGCGAKGNYNDGDYHVHKQDPEGGTAIHGVQGKQ